MYCNLFKKLIKNHIIFSNKIYFHGLFPKQQTTWAIIFVQICVSRQFKFFFFFYLKSVSLSFFLSSVFNFFFFLINFFFCFFLINTWHSRSEHILNTGGPDKINFYTLLWHFTYGVFFSTEKCALFSKNAISCFFLKNVSPSKRMVCFILNNLHIRMVEDFALYALYKSKVLIIPCKADGFRLFIKWNLKKVAWYRYPILELIFSLICGVTLRKHCIINATWSLI